MTDHLLHLLASLENESEIGIWEAGKELCSVIGEVNLTLLNLLTEGQRTETRAAAAYVLGFTRHAAARSVLEAALESPSEDPSVRGHAAEALAYIRDRGSVAVLIKHLDDSPSVAYWCAFALGQIGDPSAIPALMLFAERVGNQSYKEHSLRSEALDAIKQIEQSQQL